MSHVITKDKVEIFYKDWGPRDAQPIVFHHGWPLSTDDWDNQMLFFVQRGYRVIAHDRRGHGRSAHVGDGHDMDHYAADASAVFEHLDLRNAVHIGHSTGGGEVARYLGRYGTKRAAKAVLVSAIPPLMLKTATNPGGLPIEVFDGIRAGLIADRSQYYRELAAPFYGANRPGSKVSQGVKDAFWMWSMQAGIAGAYQCIKAFSETDLTEEIKQIDIPTLLLHGDDDQIVPIADSALLSSKLISKATLKVYPGAPHGLMATHRGQFNSDLLGFIQG